MLGNPNRGPHVKLERVKGRERAIDWPTIISYLRDVRNASGASAEPRPNKAMPAVDAHQVRAFRAHATHLEHRFPPGSVAEAAYGGLQDSAPRDALLALHARVEEITPDSWRHPNLVQIWFRWADYVVPRAGVDVFTLGAMPRDETCASALTDLADAVVGSIKGQEGLPREVAASLEGIPSPVMIRAANVTGRFHIRWDARTVTILRAPIPNSDPEMARLELARRYLRWLGPSSARRFARWAGITRRDAAETWSALAGELVQVAVEGKQRSLLAADLQALTEAEPINGVRFIPQGDPYRSSDRLIAQSEPQLDFPDIDRRLVNSLAAGRVMLDGHLVASWGRRQNHLTIAPWSHLAERVRQWIVEEAEALAGPIGKPMKIRWLVRS